MNVVQNRWRWKVLENSRLGFFILLLLGLVIAAASFINYENNIAPQYNYIDSAVSSLDKVKGVETFEEKMMYVNEAIETYQQGPNLEKLQILASLNTVEQIDALLENTRTPLNSEYFRHITAFSNVKAAILEIAFIVTTLVGTVANYRTWKTDDQHLVVAITFALLLAIFVVLSP